MIFTLFLAAIVGLIDLITNLLPVWTPIEFPTGVSSEDMPWTSWAWLINHFFPLDTALTLAALLLTMWLAAHIYGAIVWALTKLHVLGGSSDG